VTFISRRSTGQRRLTRLISNEAEVATMLGTLQGVQFQAADLAALSLRQQLVLLSDTDILLGEVQECMCTSR
jgi:hypothetical protein